MKIAKFKTKQEFLEVDNKIVDYRNSITDNSYIKSGTLFEYYSDSIEPSKDGYFYVIISQDLIDDGLLEGVALVDSLPKDITDTVEI
jgi:hypothetical protein